MGRFPRRTNPDDMRHLLYRVTGAWVDGRGVLRFEYDDGAGNRLNGPGYPSTVNGEVPVAWRVLAAHGLTDPGEVKYLVAYHCGAVPMGIPVCLLRCLDDIPDRYLPAESEEGRG